MIIDPRETSYDVKVWKITSYKGKTVTTYRVRWTVAGREQRQGFRAAAAADSFRSELVSAQRQGEAFDVESGLPISKIRRSAPPVTWYEFACSYVDMKWPRISAKYRKGVAEALVTVTCSLLTEELSEQEAKAVRSALLNWGFNTLRRSSAEQPDDVTRRLAWVAGHSRAVSDLAQADTLRQALEAVATRLDGREAAGRTTHRKRVVLSNALSYAAERGLLSANPIGSIKWKAPLSATASVEKQCVPNPTQARAFLDAVKVARRSGPRLHAFFACLYFSALRPEEAVNLRRSNLDLPEAGWGWIVLSKAAPDAGKAWTDDGAQRQQRQLKHRAVGDSRRVPCPPELVTILRAHLDRFGTDSQGRLFRGEQGGELATVTYTRMWQRARQAVLGVGEAATSPLAKRPYDLRHAAVSTWLASSNDPAQVAEWAGHSIDVLHRIYAKVVDGRQEDTLRRIQEALEPSGRLDMGGQLAVPRVSGRRRPRRRPPRV